MRPLVLLFAALAACSPTRSTSPLAGTTEDDPLTLCMENCRGCCDTDGRCFTGNATNACGRSGDLCTTCSSDQACSFGRCMTPLPVVPSTPPRPGEISLRWRFSGHACAIVRDVSKVTIDIPGLVLPNQGIFPCSAGAIDGVTLLSAQPDLYRYTARALTADNRLLYETSGLFTVDGPTLERIDLKPVVGATGAAAISWRLPTRTGATWSCAGLGIATITATTSGVSPVTSPCDASMLSLGRLPAGTRTVSLVAHDPNGFALATAQSTVTVVAGAETSSELSLSWAVGSLPVQWSFTNQAFTQTCLEAGVSEVYLNLMNDQDRFVFAGAGVNVPCVSQGLAATTFPALSPGRYTVFGQAVASSGALYRSAGVPTTVRAGVFPSSTAGVLLTLSL